MNKYFAFIALSFFILFSSNSNAQILSSFSTCDCFIKSSYSLKSYYNKYLSYCILCSDKKSDLYPNYLIGLELSKNLIEKPLYFFEYTNNSNIYTQLLLNEQDVEIKQCLMCPKFGTPEIARKNYQIKIRKNKEIDEIIRLKFREIYHNCYKYEHNNPLTLYDNGFLAFTEGNVEEAVKCAEKYIVIQKDLNNENCIQPQEMLLLGESYLELSEYSKAIDILSQLIEQDPTNKNAYFARSSAHFETGNFDQAIQDYLDFKQDEKISQSFFETSKNFSEALLGSAIIGAGESIVDFVPSLCRSAYGLSEILWITVQHPIESTKNFTDACYEMGQCLTEYCKSVEWNTIDEYKDQVEISYERFDSLAATEKGEFIGYIVGKYGVDIFSGKACMKGVAAYRKLKAANRICNLEVMISSPANKKAIIDSSLRHAAHRKAYIKNVKYNFDSHNKHILSHNDFDPKRSIWQHKDPEGLLKDFAGTGYPGKGEFGMPGFRENVDFKEHIGIWKNMKGTLELPTTRGTIHYGKKGAHIVPSDPNPKF